MLNTERVPLDRRRQDADAASATARTATITISGSIPDDSKHLVLANDGGGAITYNVDVAAAQLVGPGFSDRAVLSRDHDEARAVSRLRRAAGQQHAVHPEQRRPRPRRRWRRRRPRHRAFYPVGGGEPGYIAPDPKDVDVFYAGTNNGSFLTRFNRAHRRAARGRRRIRASSPARPASAVVERWQWTYPIIFSPVDPNVLYTSSQHVWKTTNGGADVGQDQRRPHPSRSEDDAGFGRADHARHEQPGDLRHGVLARARQDRRQRHLGRIGRRRRARDARRRQDLDERHAEGHAGSRPRQPDRRVGVRRRHGVHRGEEAAARRTSRRTSSARTTTAGRGRRSSTASRPNDYTHVVREDPARRGLLYAGHAARLLRLVRRRRSLAAAARATCRTRQVSDIWVDANDIAIATHGRGFYVLDDIAPLRQYGAPVTSGGRRVSVQAGRRGSIRRTPARITLLAEEAGAEADARDPRRQRPGRAHVRRRAAGCGGQAGQEGRVSGQGGAQVRQRRRVPQLRQCGGDRGRHDGDRRADDEEGGGRGRGGPPTASMAAGVNRFTWDLQYAPVDAVPGHGALGRDDERSDGAAGHVSGAAHRRRPRADAADHGEEAPVLQRHATPTCASSSSSRARFATR